MSARQSGVSAPGTRDRQQRVDRESVQDHGLRAVARQAVLRATHIVDIAAAGEQATWAVQPWCAREEKLVDRVQTASAAASTSGIRTE